MADKIKFGYMNYNDIQDHIDEESLNAYDVVFTKDSHEAIVITPELTLMALQGKIEFYTSISNAETSLNNRPDTYIGKIVAVTVDGQVKGYITSFENGRYVINPIGIDNYNDLLNKPSINGIPLVGNYNETDPTVPAWAKTETKPSYSAEEVGAIDSESFNTFKEETENNIANLKDLKGKPTSLIKVEDYLYKISYDNLDYDFAEEYLNTHYFPIGACSSVRKNNLYGRKYDWYYDYTPEFITYLPAIDKKHSSISICHGVGELTAQFVDTGKYSDVYKVVPFTALDGINDAGIVCNINVVPSGDWGTTSGTIPAIELKQNLNTFTVLRFVLDNFDNATSAVEYLRDYCSIKMIHTDNQNIECHYMIADSLKTYVVEFLNNQIEIIDISENPYMTNFYLKNAEFNASTGLVDRTTLTSHGQGVERYELIANSYDNISTKEQMSNLMYELNYTNSYKLETTPFWYTEFTGDFETWGDLTVTSPIEDFDGIIAYSINEYQNRSRDNKSTWHSVHTSVYDMENKILYIIPQETENEYTINFPITNDLLDGKQNVADNNLTTESKTVVGAINELKDSIPNNAADIVYTDVTSGFPPVSVEEIISGLGNKQFPNTPVNLIFNYEISNYGLNEEQNSKIKIDYFDSSNELVDTIILNQTETITGKYWHNFYIRFDNASSKWIISNGGNIVYYNNIKYNSYTIILELDTTFDENYFIEEEISYRYYTCAYDANDNSLHLFLSSYAENPIERVQLLSDVSKNISQKDNFYDLSYYFHSSFGRVYFDSQVWYIKCGYKMAGAGASLSSYLTIEKTNSFQCYYMESCSGASKISIDNYTFLRDCNDVQSALDYLYLNKLNTKPEVLNVTTDGYFGGDVYSNNIKLSKEKEFKFNNDEWAQTPTLSDYTNYASLNNFFVASGVTYEGDIFSENTTFNFPQSGWQKTISFDIQDPSTLWGKTIEFGALYYNPNYTEEAWSPYWDIDYTINGERKYEFKHTFDNGSNIIPENTNGFSYIFTVPENCTILSFRLAQASHTPASGGSLTVYYPYVVDINQFKQATKNNSVFSIDRVKDSVPYVQKPNTLYFYDNGKVLITDNMNRSVDCGSNKVDKVENASQDNIALLTLNGNIADSGININKINLDNALPRIYIEGTLPTEKTYLDCIFNYDDGIQVNKIYGKIKCQGTSSMNYPKKNFTIQFYEDSTRVDKKNVIVKGGWGAQSNYCLKANYIDHSHMRNITAGNLWKEIVESRSDYDNLPTEIKEAYCHGAVDGFPIKLYANGIYQGIYTMNIPKSAWMFNMDKSNPNHIVLCAETNSHDPNLQTACNFKKVWNGVDGNDWSIEVGENSQELVSSLNAFITFVKDSTNAQFISNLSTYADVQSIIDYYILCYFICALDNLGKNMILLTYDLQKWYLSPYDLDSTFGNYWNGTRLVEYNYRCPEDYEEQYSLLFKRVWELFPLEFKARYEELRETVLNYSNMFPNFEDFADTITETLYNRDVVIYSGIPNAENNNVFQIENFLSQRTPYVDNIFSNIVERIPCTAVSCDSTLTLSSSASVNINIAVTPLNTTENITCSSSNPSVAIVDNLGNVTALASGICTITVKCGDAYATCDVTANLETEKYIQQSVSIFKKSSSSKWKDMASGEYIELPIVQSGVALKNINSNTVVDIWQYDENKTQLAKWENAYQTWANGAMLTQPGTKYIRISVNDVNDEYNNVEVLAGVRVCNLPTVTWEKGAGNTSTGVITPSETSNAYYSSLITNVTGTAKLTILNATDTSFVWKGYWAYEDDGTFIHAKNNYDGGWASIGYYQLDFDHNVNLRICASNAQYDPRKLTVSVFDPNYSIASDYVSNSYTLVRDGETNWYKMDEDDYFEIPLGSCVSFNNIGYWTLYEEFDINKERVYYWDGVYDGAVQFTNPNTKYIRVSFVDEYHQLTSVNMLGGGTNLLSNVTWSEGGINDSTGEIGTAPSDDWHTSEINMPNGCHFVAIGNTSTDAEYTWKTLARYNSEGTFIHTDNNDGGWTSPTKLNINDTNSTKIRFKVYTAGLSTPDSTKLRAFDFDKNYQV